jgi:hypothetical protein
MAPQLRVQLIGPQPIQHCTVCAEYSRDHRTGNPHNTCNSRHVQTSPGACGKRRSALYANTSPSATTCCHLYHKRHSFVSQQAQSGSCCPSRDT